MECLYVRGRYMRNSAGPQGFPEAFTRRSTESLRNAWSARNSASPNRRPEYFVAYTLHFDLKRRALIRFSQKAAC